MCFVSFQVAKVVTKVSKLVDVANINSTLAKTVVNIISNVMTSSDATNATTSGAYVHYLLASLCCILLHCYCTVVLLLYTTCAVLYCTVLCLYSLVL